MPESRIDNMLALNEHVAVDERIRRGYWNTEQVWGRVIELERRIEGLLEGFSGVDGAISTASIKNKIAAAKEEAEEYAFFLMEQ